MALQKRQDRINNRINELLLKLSKLSLRTQIVFFVVSLTVTLTPIVICFSVVQDGPESETVKTYGIFRPGGYVHFTILPGIRSVHGSHGATLEVYVEVSEAHQLEGIQLPGRTHEVGGGFWADRPPPRGIPYEDRQELYEEFDLHIEWDIPDNRALGGETVTVIVTARVRYPKAVQASYYEIRTGHITERVPIQLEEGRVMLWESLAGALRRTQKPMDLTMFIAVLIWVPAILTTIVSLINLIAATYRRAKPAPRRW